MLLFEGLPSIAMKLLQVLEPGTHGELLESRKGWLCMSLHTCERQHSTGFASALRLMQAGWLSYASIHCEAAIHVFANTTLVVGVPTYLHILNGLQQQYVRQQQEMMLMQLFMYEIPHRLARHLPVAGCTC